MEFLRTPLSGCLLLLLLLVTAFDQSRAQVPPSLNAAGLIPATSPLTAFFAEGESTTILGTGLPICTIAQQAGSYLELYNVDTGFIAGWHGPFDNTPSGSGFVTPAFWNTTAYPVLNTSYTGLYRCRTDTANSLVTYQLNVRVALNVTCPADFRIEENETLTKVFNVPTSIPSTITNTPNIGNLTETSITSPTNVAWVVPWSDPALRLAENVTVAWNFSYVDGMCSGVTGQPRVLTNCTAVSTSTCTINVLKVKNCRNVSVEEINVTVPILSAPDFVLKNVGCLSGYQTNTRPVVRNVHCQLNGTWTTFPKCEDIIDCPGVCNNMSNCMDVPGSFQCSCPKGYTGNGLADEICSDINECKASDPCPCLSTCMNNQGNFSCICPSGYIYNASGRICQDAIDCPAACNEKSICTDVPGSFHCTCPVGYTGSGKANETCVKMSPIEAHELVAGGLGSFCGGVLLGAACCYFIIMRKLSVSSSHQDVKLGTLPHIGTTTVNMTTSDAYGIPDMPAERHNYDYIPAISDNK